ncbi:MAG: glycine cleavage system protein GcvH, partial [Pseudomonadota bacterium]
MNLPADLKYAESHEWCKIEDGKATCGISDYAQDQLGDVVFVEVPEVGRTVEAGEAIAVVESVKSASDIYAPVSGTVVEANGELADSPELVNDAPYEGGWLFRCDPVQAAMLFASIVYESRPSDMSAKHTRSLK